jgi:hypothetical protein
MPSKMTAGSLSDNISRASLELREQSLRNPSTYRSGGQLADPDTEEEDNVLGQAGQEIWKLLPQLQHVPESTLKKLPLSAIFQLSNALTKSSKIADKMSVNSRLAMNADKAAKNPVQSTAARTTGGTFCMKADFWEGPAVLWRTCGSAEEK